MRHIAVRNWDRQNRSERIESIVAALGSSGQVEAKYSRGRLYLARLLLGKGHPKPVNKENNWNQVKISYCGKDAIEILDSDFGPEGRFFDENFTKSETRQMKDALADAEVFFQKAYLSRIKWIRISQASGLLLGSIYVINGLLSADPLLMILLAFVVTLYFLISLSRT